MIYVERELHCGWNLCALHQVPHINTLVDIARLTIYELLTSVRHGYIGISGGIRCCRSRTMNTDRKTSLQPFHYFCFCPSASIVFACAKTISCTKSKKQWPGARRSRNPCLGEMILSFNCTCRRLIYVPIKNKASVSVTCRRQLTPR
jgi:hypothetical protein